MKDPRWLSQQSFSCSTFDNSVLATLAKYYFSYDGDYEAAAYAEDREFAKEDPLFNLLPNADDGSFRSGFILGVLR
jgi:hypothetical protein